MFKLQRFYSLTSFAVIFVAALLLTLFYRQVTMYWIEHLATTNNEAMAQIALEAIGPELTDYLGTVTDSGKSKIVQRGMPDEVAERLYRIAQDTPLGSVQIYTRDGAVAFSTWAETVSADHSGDPGFRTAIAGNATNAMVFHDLLNSFSATTAEDNVMQSYLPIREEPDAPPVGVFHIRSDMSHLVAESNKVMLFILAGAELILALLYAVLFFVVRYANNVIHHQTAAIKERAANLETLSKDLLKGDELKKKKIATDLHEGLAQTLSAIKINVESSGQQKAAADTQSLGSIVPVLQRAINEVRTIATELHPSSLDDLGLLPTINWFCREFERQHPEIRVRREISLPEGSIPPQLKIDIYRIVESAFRNIAKYSNTDQISFVLHLADDMIHLIIGDTPSSMKPATARATAWESGADPRYRFAELKERTSLSGGVFFHRLEKLGGVTLRASWACNQ